MTGVVARKAGVDLVVEEVGLLEVVVLAPT